MVPGDFEWRGGEGVRGKLRDKRTDARRERMKRDMMERRRPPKRNNRMIVHLNRQLEEEYMLDGEEEYAPVMAGR